MILTCPSCSASYMVPSEAIGDSGRDVRCKKCGHTWFQPSEKDSLDELITRIQAVDDHDNDLSFDDSLPSQGHVKNQKADSSIFTKLIKKISGVLKGNADRFARGKAVLLPNEKARRVVGMAASAGAGFVVFACLLSGLIVARGSVAGVIPETIPLYKLAGFSVDSHVFINPEDSLVIERPQILLNEHGGELKGSVINLTALEVPLPKISVTYLDGHGQVLKTEAHHLSQPSIQKESSVDFSFPVEKDVAGGLAQVEFRFTE